MSPSNTTSRMPREYSQLFYAFLLATALTVTQSATATLKQPAYPEKSDFDNTYKARDFDTLRADAEKGDITAQFRHGNALAQFQLGSRNFFGKGVKKDYAEAVKWFRQAAAQGESSAEYDLGYCYARGAGVSADYVQSYKWNMLAFRNRLESAQQTLLELEKLMTPEQIAEGKRLADEFKPANQSKW